MSSPLPIMSEIKVDSGAACCQSHMRCSPNISALHQSLFSLWFPLIGAQCQENRGLLRGLKSAQTKKGQSPLYQPALSAYTIKHVKPLVVSTNLLWTRVEVYQDKQVTHIRSKLLVIQGD